MHVMPSSIQNKSIADLNIGILGGGQLARMLTLRGFELGAKVHIFSEHPEDPAAQVTRYWHQGKADSKSELRAFFRDVRVATFESEFMDTDLLTELSLEANVPVYPRPSLMAEIQDRFLQKTLLQKSKLPTSEFITVNTVDELRAAYAEFGPIVLKKRRFGYDGYGTHIIKTESAIDPLTEIIEQEKTGFIAERFIKFKRELACVMVRSIDGSIAELPFVESNQEDARCLWVKGPVKSSARLAALASQLRKFLKSIEYVGAMGFEIFETDYDLLINELAPRVHNTGHYSMNALSEDQFTLHMKAVAGIKISSPRALAPGFAMYNLLGTSTEPPQWSEIPDGVSLHWYGKKENRNGRKMGHINALGTTPEVALNTLKIARRKFNV